METIAYSIGTNAGRIWEYLHTHGSASAIKIKSELGISNGMLHLALGWLSREDKIEITESGHTLRISLKDNS